MNTIDWSKPIQRRDGRKARMLCLDYKCATNTLQPVLVAVTDDSGYEHAEQYYLDGRWTNAPGFAPRDIINVPETAPETESVTLEIREGGFGVINRDRGMTTEGRLLGTLKISRRVSGGVTAPIFVRIERIASSSYTSADSGIMFNVP